MKYKFDGETPNMDNYYSVLTHKNDVLRTDPNEPEEDKEFTLEINYCDVIEVEVDGEINRFPVIEKRTVTFK